MSLGDRFPVSYFFRDSTAALCAFKIGPTTSVKITVFLYSWFSSPSRFTLVTVCGAGNFECIKIFIISLLRNRKMKQIHRRCLQLAKNLVTAQIRSISSSVVDVAIDPNQAASFDEPCILVNEKDEVIGRASKRDCHLVGASKNHDGLLLHRAFSVFLFNSKGEMLVQRRSNYKVTFPGEFANACCSHPLYTDEELEENGQDNESVAIGVKRAASRRLEYELGIPSELTRPECFMYLTRFHYHSLSGINDSQKKLEGVGNSSVWGEHEIDYILILRGDMEIKPNPNEVMEVKLLTRDGLVPFLHSLSQKGIRVTPWFKLVVKHWLPLWWENLHQLEKFQDHGTIHKL